MLSKPQIQSLEQLHQNWTKKYKLSELRTTFPFSKNLIDLYRWFNNLIDERNDVEDYDFEAYVDPLLTIHENKQVLKEYIVSDTSYHNWTAETKYQINKEAEKYGLFQTRDQRIKDLEKKNHKIKQKIVEARNTHTIKQSSDKETHKMKYFDVELAKKSNIAIYGFPGCGKTNLARQIISQLHKQKYWIALIDPVGIHKNYGDITLVQQVNGALTNQIYQQLTIPPESVIYDISGLLLSQQQQLISDYLTAYWIYRSKTPQNTRHNMIIFEEAQLFAKNIRSKTGQQILRIATAGRNKPYLTRILAVSQRIANVDTSISELCEQLYVGFTLGENNLRKVKVLLGKKYVKVVQHLQVGEFVWRHGTKIETVQTPIFKNQKQTLLENSE